MTSHLLNIYLISTKNTCICWNLVDSSVVTNYYYLKILYCSLAHLGFEYRSIICSPYQIDLIQGLNNVPSCF